MCVLRGVVDRVVVCWARVDSWQLVSAKMPQVYSVDLFESPGSLGRLVALEKEQGPDVSVRPLSCCCYRQSVIGPVPAAG